MNKELIGKKDAEIRAAMNSTVPQPEREEAWEKEFENEKDKPHYIDGKLVSFKQWVNTFIRTLIEHTRAEERVDVYIKAHEWAIRNSQVVGPKNDYYVTLQELERFLPPTSNAQ